jgi:hypothetical protein
MTMEIVRKANNEIVVNNKMMIDMKRGEVCYCEENNQYVMKISSVEQGKFIPVYLILQEDDDISFKSEGVAIYTTVRELYPNESITIKFS